MNSNCSTPKICPKELHRRRQRYQYHHMIHNLNELNAVLPTPSNSAKAEKTQTKQHIIIESVQYIEYLQYCIFELSKLLGIEKAVFLEQHGITEHSIPILNNNNNPVLNTSNTSYIKTEKPDESKLGFNLSDSSQNQGREARVSEPLQTIAQPRYARNTIDIKNTHSRNDKRKIKRIPQVHKKGKVNSTRKSLLKKVPAKSRTKNKFGFITPTSNATSTKTCGPFIKINSDLKISPTLKFQFLSPPSGYKRTVIEESPNTINQFTWKKVAVKHNEPWMPRPVDDKTPTTVDHEISSECIVFPTTPVHRSMSFLPDGFVDSDNDDVIPLCKNNIGSSYSSEVQSCSSILTVNTNTSLCSKKYNKLSHLQKTFSPDSKNFSPRIFLTKC